MPSLEERVAALELAVQELLRPHRPCVKYIDGELYYRPVYEKEYRKVDLSNIPVELR